MPKLTKITAIFSLQCVSFADNQCLLELTHRGPAEGGPPGECKWIPITKKVYWPPTGTAAAAAASHNGQNGPSGGQPGGIGGGAHGPQPVNALQAKSEAGSVISQHSGKTDRGNIKTSLI